jgi:hypothetical protein
VNRNDGISISGGNVSSTAMAAGRNARATVNAGGDVVVAAHPDVAPVLQALVAALGRHGAELSPAAVEAGEEVAAELAQPEPSRSRVKELLATLTEGAGSVTAVAGAAEALRKVLDVLW